MLLDPLQAKKIPEFPDIRWVYFLFEGFLFFLICFSCFSCGSKPPLLSGPMVGAVGMRSALLWVQFDYHDSSFSSYRSSYFSFPSFLSSSHGPSDRENSLFFGTVFLEIDKVGKFSAGMDSHTGIAVFEIPDLEPSTEYSYRIVGYPQAKGRFRTKPLWKYRKENPPDFSFLIASCHYVNEEPYDRKGNSYGGGYEIFRSIEKENADFFLWMGDNVYLREADWDSFYGILHRYSHTRALAESRNTFSQFPHFAIWDDHDYGPNDASLAYSLSHVTEKIFKNFWPDFNYPQKGIYRSFTWGDAEFFLLDNRTFRTANKNHVFGKRTILGEEQIHWLFQALADSTARFKFIVMGGQFLNSEPVFENYANYAEERKRILDTIQRLDLENVIFLTGDRHHSEISLWKEGRKEILEVTVSPLTAGVPSSPREKNLYRIPGSLFWERLYGVIEIRTREKENDKEKENTVVKESAGKKENPEKKKDPEDKKPLLTRELRIFLKNTAGNTVYTYTIDARL